MRRQWKWRPWRHVVLILAVYAAVALLFTAGFRGMSFQCDDHPPRETFVRYFDEVPPGVWDIRATGHISVGGADVWMRFRGTESALQTVTHGYTKLTPTDAAERVSYLAEKGGMGSPLPEKPGLSEEHRVYWDGLKRIERPAVYDKPQQFSGSRSTLIIDRPRGLAYFYHWNQ